MTRHERERVALVRSVVTVPAFGLGINPLGPSTRPNFATFGIISGVAMALSKSMNPSAISEINISPPTISAPASFASFSLSPGHRTAIRSSFPVPLGKVTTGSSLRRDEGSRRHRTCRSELLIGVTRIQGSFAMKLDSLIKFRRCHLFERIDRLDG